MQRLTGLDAGYLYLETGTSPMHVSSLMILDPSSAPNGFDFDSLKRLFLDRIHLAPPFRRRLVEVPLGIHHPIWVEDPDFDLDWHLRHIAVPSPGGMAELNELVGHLIAIPLDRTRPLWECWLIEGVEGGHVALLAKVHHSAIDGEAGEELIVTLLDAQPEGPDGALVADPAQADPVEADGVDADRSQPDPGQPDPGQPEPGQPGRATTDDWQAEHVPGDLEMFTHALISLSTQPWRVVKTTRRTASAVLQIRRNNRSMPSLAPPPSPFSAPRTSFNHALTPHRSFATRSLDLKTVKDIKNTFGVKVNDVVLAVCAGALRRYLDRRDENPARSLVAMVPVSVRTGDDAAGGNKVSTMFTTLATKIDDPVERLLAISTSMSQAKAQQNAIGADTLQNWAEFAAPAVAGQAARLYSRMRIADRHRPAFNLTISNVPGPPFPLYIAGARVVANYPAGPIFDGGGLNITVMSYRDSLDFGLLVCPELISDPQVLADDLQDALDELLAAAGRG